MNSAMVGAIHAIFKTLALGAALLALGFLLSRPASAGAFEVSGGFNFNRSNYSETSYSWNRRWGASVGYHFTERSGIEFSFQDVVDRTMISGYEDTTFHDQVASINWIQELLGKKYAVQPYFKVGVGQLNRTATGVYAGGGSPPLLVDSLTGVAGAGLRIYLTRTFGLRFEGTSYLSGGSIATWRDNFALSFGASIYF